MNPLNFVSHAMICFHYLNCESMLSLAIKKKKLSTVMLIVIRHLRNLSFNWRRKNMDKGALCKNRRDRYHYLVLIITFWYSFIGIVNASVMICLRHRHQSIVFLLFQ